MADIRFLVDDIDQTEEDQEDEGYEMEEDSSILDQITAEELLSAAVKMERFMHSDIVFNRQMAARYVQEALRTSRTKEEIHHVLRLMVRLSDDIEPSVRVELMEQVPHVAVYCYEHHSLMDAIPQYILYIVLRYLTDTNNQVRKTSQAALLVLLEQEVVERADVEEQVCPVLLQLTSGDSSDDYRSEAVALLSKMAPLVGKDITERYFLPRFEVLCSDPLFHVRKVCASNFGEICSVIGPEVTQDKMV